MPPPHLRSSGWPGRRWVFLAAGLLGIFALAAFAILGRSRSPYFSDPLTGPTSPKLSIPAGKYGYTPQGLRRNQSASGLDRAMVRTVSRAYLTTPHFTGEVSVNVAAGDIAFVGVGQATNDADDIGEPSNCFLFRILNLADTQIDVAAAQTGRETHFLDIRKVAAYVPGTTIRFRIVRDGDYVTLSIPSQNVSQTYSISQYNAQLGLTADNTCLFFGNTAVGTVFSNFSVGPTAAPDDEASSGDHEHE
jgi:hypothetical protein